MLTYWVNYEDGSIDARARTVQMTTRFYSPVVSGVCLDLRWEHHFRARMLIEGEWYASLTIHVREPGDVDLHNPVHTHPDLNHGHNTKRKRTTMQTDSSIVCIVSRCGDRIRWATRCRIRRLLQQFLGPTTPSWRSKDDPLVLELLYAAAGVGVVREHDTTWLSR